MTNRLHLAVAAAAVAAGAGMLGTALGGMAAVDSDLRAVSDARVAESRPVVRLASTGLPEVGAYDRPEDCPRDPAGPPEV